MKNEFWGGEISSNVSKSYTLPLNLEPTRKTWLLTTHLQHSDGKFHYIKLLAECTVLEKQYCINSSIILKYF